MSPLVSVLMPVRNGADYLRPAIESILAQTWTDFEFLILDDGSTDGTAAILADYQSRDDRIRCLSHTARGVTPALNELARQARGELLARMDADDISEPQRLSKQVAALQQHPDCIVIGCQILFIDQEGAVLTQSHYPMPPSEIEHQLRTGVTALPHPGTMIRREALARVGGYDESFEAAQDLDLWLRLMEFGELRNLPEVLLQYRIHPKAISAARRQQQIEAVQRAVHRAHRQQNHTVPDSQLVSVLPEAGGSTDDVSRRCAIMALEGGALRTARKHAWRAVRRAPWKILHWYILAKSISGWRRPLFTPASGTTDPQQPMAGGAQSASKSGSEPLSGNKGTG